MAVTRFPVEGSHILMFARAIGDPNPAYAGALNGTPSVAPPTFVWAAEHFDPHSIVRPRPGEPWMGSGAEDSGTPDSPARGGLHAEQRYDFHRPVREGDVLTASSRIGRTWTKQGRRGGLLTFTQVITEYRDQHSELVVTAVMVGVETEHSVGGEA
jgi:hypothetical protein